ncbi:MAG: hypothetical protein K6C98_03060 [Treponema sp.]|nr:hypothetical protein [Treponema sp.]
MKRLCILLSVLILLSSAVHSQNQNSSANTEPLLSKFSFSGLKRTKESFLQQEFSSYIGKPLTSKVLAKFESDLQALNIFSSIKFTMLPEAEDSAELLIIVTEKVSFIPLPFAMYSSSTGFMMGGFIMDMNAGGQKDMFVTGLIWAPDKIMAMGTYAHPPKTGVPGFSVFGSVSKQESKLRNADGEDLLKFESFNANAIGNILFKLNRYNSASTGLGYSGFFPSDTDFHSDIYLRNRALTNASWNISDKNWNGVFLSETSFGLRGQLSIDNKSHVVTEFAASAKIQQPVVQKLRLNIEAGGGIVIEPLITDGLGNGNARVAILDDGFSSDRIAGLSSGFEYAFLQTKKIGTFSVYGDYQFVFARDFDDSLVFCQGFNSGMKVYMKGLAFPAVSMGLAYNATKNKFYFSGSFGVSF